LREAHGALRSHVEERRRRASSAELERARDDELRELDAALELLCSSGSPTLVRWLAGRRHLLLILWAVLATGLAVFLVLSSWLDQPPVARREARVLAEVEVEALGGATGATGAAADALVTVIAVGAAAAPADAATGVAVASTRMELIAEANLPGATLQIRSEPGAAPEVEGPADSRSYWLESGDYELRVSHPDCPDSWDQTVRAERGGQLELSPMVCVETGWLLVKASEPDAQVVIDGKQSGTAGPIRRSLSVGEHRVQVEKRGFESWQGLVEIQSAQLLELWAELERAKEQEKREGQRESEPTVSKQEARAVHENWHDRVTQWLLARYDSDGSGLIDTLDELERIPCDEWLSLEASFDRGGLGLSLIRIYGLDHVDTGGDWVENALGIGYGMSDHAYKRMRTCGLK
jgi:hypothetical protein